MSDNLVKGNALRCASCTADMELKERLPNIGNKSKNYRRRRFKCPVCGYTEMIIADGKYISYFDKIDEDSRKRLHSDKNKSKYQIKNGE